VFSGYDFFFLKKSACLTITTTTKENKNEAKANANEINRLERDSGKVSFAFGGQSSFFFAQLKHDFSKDIHNNGQDHGCLFR
jgi:hypothetical protein